MNSIADLQSSWFLARHRLGSHQACIDWAIERLELDQEGNDNDVVLLAGATRHEESMQLATKIIERYAGPRATDEQLLAGKFIVQLHTAYREGSETITSLDKVILKLYVDLGHPDWLTMLSRNCEYATDVPAFREPFEKEFDYLAGLWSSVSDRTDFEAEYDRSVSDQHDVK